VSDVLDGHILVAALHLQDALRSMPLDHPHRRLLLLAEETLAKVRRNIDRDRRKAGRPLIELVDDW
jgi:hypothetical protein